MARLLTLGETLGVAWTAVGEPLRTTSLLQLSVAGAESTVAIGMRRLGHEAVWVGAVGADALGERVRRELAAEGVDVRFVRTVDAPTGLMLRDRASAEYLTVTYYRAGSAGSRLTAGDVEAAFEALPELDVLHVTGITPALSDSCHEAVQRAVGLARARDVLVSFDVNLRRTLPGSPHVGPRARALLADVDVLFVGDDELPAVSDTADPDAAAAELLRAGPAEVVLKRGTGGATTWLADGGRHSEPAMRVAVADTVGAGDSFVAGYLAARCDGCPVPERLARGALAAACTVGTHGDWEGLPTAAQVAGRSAQPVTLR